MEIFNLPCEGTCPDQQPECSRAWYWGTDQLNEESLWLPNRSSAQPSLLVQPNPWSKKRTTAPKQDNKSNP